MKIAREFVTSTIIGGVFVVVPIYLATLLLFKGMQSVAKLVRPIAALLPDWLPAEGFFSLIVLVVVCFLVGAAVRTRVGRTVQERLEIMFFERLPGYGSYADIEDALVPAFVIEELDDGRLTVFVPSVPTPLAGAVYILARTRVHLLDIPFTQAIKSISRWGSGSKDLVAAIEPPRL